MACPGETDCEATRSLAETRRMRKESNRPVFRDACSEVEESVVLSLASKGPKRHTKQMLRSLLRGPARTADLDERLAMACFPFGFPELGAAFAARAALTLQSAGATADAARVLGEAEKAGDACGSKTLVVLAEGRVGLGWVEDAARLMVRAADRAREEGQPLRALECCLRASRWASGARGLHRAWGLALLAWGDAEGASGHLERWCEEEAASIVPLLWALHASWGRRSLANSGPLLERLVERLGVRATAPSEAALRERIRERLRSEPPFTATPGLPPFWESEELSRLLSGRTWPKPRRRVVAVEGAVSDLEALARILERWGIELSVVSRSEAASHETRRWLAVDLALVPLVATAELARVQLLRLRSLPGLEHTPVLGVAALDGAPLDRASLQQLGVVGLVQRAVTPEDLAFRVASTLGLSPDAGRAQVRVPVDFAVELDAEGSSTLERAENLSCGGIRLRCARALPVNTPVRVLFEAGLEPSPQALEGRVLHCSPSPSGDGHRVGVFFFALEPAQLARLQAEVDRRLDVRAEPAGDACLAG